MKLTSVFLGLGLVAGDQLAAESGNLDDPSDQSMGAGITDHGDDQFNQLSKAPTPAPYNSQKTWGKLTHGWVMLKKKTKYSCHIVKVRDPTGHWCVQDDLATVSSDDENYGRSEQCDFRFHGDDTIKVENFEIEGDWSSRNRGCPYDWLSMNGVKHCGPISGYSSWNWHTSTAGLKRGDAMPSSFAVSGVTDFQFKSDSIFQYKGFKLCAMDRSDETGDTAQIAEQAALEAMPTSQPTSFPTKIQDDANAVGDTHDVDYGWAIEAQTKTTVNYTPGRWVYTYARRCYWTNRCTRTTCSYSFRRNDRCGNRRYRRSRCTRYQRYRRCYNQRISSTYIPAKTTTTVTSGAAASVCHIEIEDDGQCISDGPGNYGNRENCRFSFTPVEGGESVLDVRQHDLEWRWDTLDFNGKSDARFNDLNGATITQKSTFEFTTDSSVVKTGFKFCVSKPVSKGSICESTVAWADGSTTKPVGWVGAGPGADYCNVWKCEAGNTEFTEQDFTGTFRKQARTCSIEEHGDAFCSHTSCTFAGSPQVIQVHSDHREEVGGFHKCGFNKHGAEQSDRLRPACDCICHGDRRQDAKGFARTLNEISHSFAMKEKDMFGMVGDQKSFTEDNMYYWPTELLADYKFGNDMAGHVDEVAGSAYARAHQELVYTPGQKYNNVVVKMKTGGWPYEMAWSGMGQNKGFWTYRYGAKVHEFRTTPGTYTINMRDSYGDGWNGGELTFTDKDTGAVYGKASLKRGRSGSATIVITKHPGTFDIETHDINSWADIALLMHGGCQIKQYRGKMAWHVNNNAGNSNVNIFDENFGESLDMCMIYTKTPLQVPAKYSDCKVSLQVRDVDAIDQGKENDDGVCMSVLSNKQQPITECHVNDARRLLGDEASRHDIAQPWGFWDGNDHFHKTGPEFLVRPTATHKIIMETRSWGYEISWDINGDSKMSGSGYSSYRYMTRAYVTEMELPAGDHTLNMRDSYGDGWNGGSIQILDSKGQVVLKKTTLSRGSSGTAKFTVAREGHKNIQYYGITRSWYDNYLTEKSLKLTTEWIPTNMLAGGFHVAIGAKTNHRNEHWFMDDLIVECREPLQRDERVVELAAQKVRLHDATTDANRWDKQFNSNNFYSQHDNHGEYSADHALSNNMANDNANTEQRMSVDGSVTEYSEKDHTYNGQRVAHLHIDN
jgi:hypothetical protein